MSNRQTLLDALGDNGDAWSAANLIQRHYADIVEQRCKQHYEKIAVNLEKRLLEEIGGEGWKVWIDGKLHKPRGFPFRIKRKEWASQSPGFVIGFEYDEANCLGSGIFGLIFDLVENRSTQLAKLPLVESGCPSSLPKGYIKTPYWIARREENNVAAPNFVCEGQVINWTREIINHYDKEDNSSTGWLTRYNTGQLKAA